MVCISDVCAPYLSLTGQLSHGFDYTLRDLWDQREGFWGGCKLSMVSLSRLNHLLLYHTAQIWSFGALNHGSFGIHGPSVPSFVYDSLRASPYDQHWSFVTTFPILHLRLETASHSVLNAQKHWHLLDVVIRYLVLVNKWLRLCQGRQMVALFCCFVCRSKWFMCILCRQIIR